MTIAKQIMFHIYAADKSIAEAKAIAASHKMRACVDCLIASQLELDDALAHAVPIKKRTRKHT